MSEVTEIAEEKPKTNEAIILEGLSDPYSTIRALVKGSLFKFMQYFWSTYDTGDFIPNWHIEKVIAVKLERIARRVANMEKREKDLIINIPPGTTKTATVSIFYPIWCWVNWYHLRFITASYTEKLALESGEYSREILRSEKFQRLFPELGVKQDKDTKGNFRVVKKEWKNTGRVPRLHTGGFRFSTSVGATFTGFHAHILIVDDPLDPMGALSKAKVVEANHWMDNVLPFRKIDQAVTVTILIMQRLHQNDPTAHLLEMMEDEIEHVCLPGEIKNYADKVKPPELKKYYSEDGLLDTKRLTWESLNVLLKKGQYTYGGQVGQDPVPLGGGMFQTDNLVLIEYPPSEYDVVQTVRYWDKAGTEGDGAYTVGWKMCRLKNGMFVVLDVKRGQWASHTREKIIKVTAQADGTDCKVYVEQEPGSGGKESAESTIRNLAGFSVFKDRPTGDKAKRADPFSVQVNEGNVQMLKGDWNKEAIDEMAHFPNSTYKDQVDAGSGAFNKLVGLKQVVIR